MKFSQLSNFQKEQYTNYLETQLQKFSAFMLSQKRENQKYRSLEEAIASHSDLIAQHQSRLQLFDLYHKQNHDSFEHLSKRINKIQEIDDRLRRLEDRQRFGSDYPSNFKSKPNREGGNPYSQNEEETSRIANLEQNYKDCMKKIKKQHEEIINCHELIDRMRTRENNQNGDKDANPEKRVERKDLKKLEKKVVRYLNERLDEIEATIRKKAKSTKSPSVKVSGFSIIDNYTIKDSKGTVTAFKIDESGTNKSEMSTILESKSIKDSKISDKPKETKKKKENQKSRSKSKSENRSKSKSKSKLHKKSKSKSQKKEIVKKKERISHSKSRSRSKQTLNKSLSVSDESNIYSSKSRSKSHTNRSLSKSKSKQRPRKISKKHSFKEKSLSNIHDLCKKRPEINLNPSLRPSERKNQGAGANRRKERGLC